jgi:hypothetical protein
MQKLASHLWISDAVIDGKQSGADEEGAPALAFADEQQQQHAERL